jgi:hypothetical protein
MTEDQMRWPDTPNQEAAPGWTPVLTPLCATLHVRINSPAWDLASEWQLLKSGRGLLSPTNPLTWFSHEELAQTPKGLVAELFADALLMDDYTRIIAASVDARAHIHQLPDHVYGAEPEEWLHIGKCVDLARCLDAREMARAAARDALSE